MRRLAAFAVLLMVCSCQQQVSIPTAQQLIANPTLLAEWQAKCNTRAYSQIAPAQKTNLCYTTQQATISIAQQSAAKDDADFYDANTRRKK